jgi:hypothetical protein
MRTVAVALALLSIVSPWATASETVPELIERLGAGAYRDRREAFRALDRAGLQALPSLQVAARSADFEVRSRASELVRRILHRQEAEKILAPTRIDVSFQDAVVADAIKDFANRAGMPVLATGDTTKLRDRKFSFKTSGTPLWEALAGFTAAANLTEWDGLTALPGLPPPLIAGHDAPQPQMMPNGRRIIANGPRNNRGREAPTFRTVYLFDGTPSAVPTLFAGAVRVRALPVGTPLNGSELDAGEIVIPLQVSAEPKIQWQNHPSIIEGSAVDATGVRWEARVIGAATAPTDDEELIINNVLGNPFAPYGTGGPSPRHQFVPLRFRRPEGNVKLLKEVSGTLSLPVRVSGELARIDSPEKAAGTTVRGAFGSLTCHSFERLPDGAYRIEVGVDLPPDVHMNPAVGNAIALRPNIQIQGNVIVQQMNSTGFALGDKSTEYLGVSLTDDKGSRYSVVQVGTINQTFGGDGTRARATLTFKPTPSVGQPARLVLNGLHPNCIELPFRFVDIPLP